MTRKLAGHDAADRQVASQNETLVGISSVSPPHSVLQDTFPLPQECVLRAHFFPLLQDDDAAAAARCAMGPADRSPSVLCRSALLKDLMMSTGG